MLGFGLPRFNLSARNQLMDISIKLVTEQQHESGRRNLRWQVGTVSANIKNFTTLGVSLPISERNSSM